MKLSTLGRGQSARITSVHHVPLLSVIALLLWG